MKPINLLKTALLALIVGAGAAGSAMAGSGCVLPTFAQQPFSPPIRIQLPDGTNGIEVNSTGNPSSFVRATLTNVPTGFSVTNGTYNAWCVNGALPLCPRDFPPCEPSIYKPILIDSYDPSSLSSAGFPGSYQWAKVNYIINKRASGGYAGYNVSEIQAAIWRLLGFDAAEESGILSGNYGFSFPGGSVANVNAIVSDANANGGGFVPGVGQLVGIVLWFPGSLQDELVPADLGKDGQPLLIEVVCTPPGSIGDTVFCDYNENGTQEPGEPGIQGVKVTLVCQTATGTVTRTAFTDSNGRYLFTNLAPGTCTVSVDQTTAPVDCNRIIPNCPLTRNVTLAAGQNFMDADFCFGPKLGRIGDTVFCDLNEDGVQQPGEPGLQGVKVTLTCNTVTGPVMKMTFTDSNGKYLFTDIPAGSCTVSVDANTAPADCNRIIPNCPLSKSVNLGIGQTFLDADFCFAPSLGTIGDTVFCDLNENGVQDPGDFGLMNVKVTLTCVTATGTVTKTAFTDPNGKYLFTGLAPGSCTVTVDPTTAPSDCNKVIPNCPLSKTVNLAAAQIFLDADFCLAPNRCVEGVIGPVDLSGLVNNYLFFFADGRTDANWQGATKGFAGNVLVDGKIAKERTSGGVPYAGTIVTSDTTLGAWQSIVNQNPGQAFATYGEMTLVSDAKTKLINAMATINGLTVTPGYASRSATSLNGLNTKDGIAKTYVINITSGFQVSSKINIIGDAGDIFILRWDTDTNPANGYQGQVKFQSGGAIVPLGDLKASNFIHVAGDINASGGGSNPLAPYPQGPRLNNGTGALITGAKDFSGGGFFTGYWLTTGDPVKGETASLSNAIFVGGWYTCSKKFSLTSGTSGVYVAPNCP